MKNLVYSFIAGSILLASFSVSMSQSAKQGNWCGFDQKLEEYFQANPNMRQQFHDDNVEIAKKASSHAHMGNKATTIIPVVIHVMHWNGQGNISKAQILDGIRIMNEDYKRLNPDTTNTRSVFKPFAGVPDVEFRLARIDPNGNCTEGITRDETPLTNNADDAVKAVNDWPASQYLNIWLVNSIDNSGGSGIILGYAQFPGYGPWNTYGVICRHDQFGTIGTSSADGRTATHEVGHCLGLLHTFQGGCAGNCSSSGDYVCDTPPVKQDTYGCNKTQNSCSNDYQGPDPWNNVNMVDQIENYMSYDACQNMFSKDQVGRMAQAVSGTSTLTNLVSNSNLIKTGTQNGAPNPICKPIADFSWNKEMICEGKKVNFKDQSYNGPVTTWSWSFPGGTPSTSPDSFPTVTYNTPGQHNVTLTVSNSTGNDSKTVQKLIWVSSNTAQHGAWQYTEGFESATTFANDWIILDPTGGQKWDLSTAAGASNSAQSMWINNHVNTVGAQDQAISPSVDLSAFGGGAIMKFKVAYRQKTSTDKDELRIYYSTNCGENWILKWVKSGTLLSTAAASSSYFTPTQSEWVEHSIDFSSIASLTNVRFMFEWTCQGGGNVFIDDINLGGTTGINDVSAVNGDVKVYPNPAEDITYIEFDLNDNVTNGNIKIYDMVGNIVAEPMTSKSLQVGYHRVMLQNSRQLKAGVYMVSVDMDGFKTLKRLMVE